MTIETERPSFRGVVCLHCKTPIPVPNIVRSLQAADEGTGLALQKSQVFVLRCWACHKEKPYRTREIVDCEGTPEAATPAARPASIRWYPPDGLVKAAKA